MPIIFCDTETYSETPIRDGTYRYAADAEVMLFAYAIDDGPIACVDLTAGEELPDFSQYIGDPDTQFVWHNSMFDRTVMRLSGLAELPIDQTYDTMVRALAHSLPGGLSILGEIFGLGEDKAKDKSGKALIQLFCKPRPKNMKLRRATAETHPKEWQEFIDYATQDIAAMRELCHKLPRWNYAGDELALWRLDQKINDRGFAVDVELAEAAIREIDIAQAKLAENVSSMTGGVVTSATQVSKLLQHILEAHGVQLPDLQKSTVERRLQDPNLPREVKELLSIRSEASKSSTSKYKALLKAVSDDGRLRGTLQFCGASRTGRWSGRTFQPQNLFRPTMKQAEIEAMIGVLKSGHIDLVTDNVMEVAANAVRGCIIAPEGKKLCVSDLSNIEGRFAAWVAEEDWKCNAFREFDNGIGEDLYKVAYGKAFDVDPATIGDQSQERQIGKVLELACIAEGQEVLTDQGLIPIEDVTRRMAVWDGVDFVKHGGVVYRGIKEVIHYEGLTATEDHIVWTEDGRQVPFGTCAREQRILQRAADGGRALRVMGDSVPDVQMEEHREPVGRVRVYDILNAGPRNRFTVSGRLVHNCGYGGGVGAFATMAAVYKMDLDHMASTALPSVPQRIKLDALNWYEKCVRDDRTTFDMTKEAFVACDSLKRMWREAHPAISSVWRELEDAAKNAIHQPEKEFTVRRLKIRKDGSWLRIILPSGRALCYPSARVNENDEIEHKGMNPYSRKWGWVPTYGGKLFENICQAGSRDIMAANMPLAEEAGYETILTVHDELITEVPDTEEYTDAGLSDILATNPSWAKDLPLAAGGFTSYRYKKG